MERLSKEPDYAKCAECSCGDARPESPEPRGGDHREPEKHGRRIYAHNRIERKAYAHGGDDDETAKPYRQVTLGYSAFCRAHWTGSLNPPGILTSDQPRAGFY